jgi:ATP-dependent Clp protease adaptor protein ClpS
MPVRTDDDVLERPKQSTKPKVERPKLWRTLIHNDDYTPAPFVVSVLVDVFRMDLRGAMGTMLECHRNGVGVCGVFPKDVAETKAAEVMDLAKAEGHPLVASAEPDPHA